MAGTAKIEIQNLRSLGLLRIFSLASVLFLFVLITWGGVVRATESGLGCPDWPLCHGRIIPPADASTLIEYSHRLLATLTGLLIFVSVAVVWKYFRNERWLLVLATLALVLLVGQVLLGGAAVETDLDARLVMTHLAVAQAILGCMLSVTLLAWWGSPFHFRFSSSPLTRPTLRYLAPMAVIGTYLLILAGSYVQASGATVACGDSWPLCHEGELFPSGKLPMVHMLHRFLALIVGLIVVAFCVQAWRLGKTVLNLRMATVAVAALYLSQILVGGFNVWLSFPKGMNVLHLALATAVWIAVLLAAALSYKYSASLDKEIDLA